jgi:hypothetical protein
MPDAAKLATDERVLGVLVSRFFKWDGFDVLKTAEAALIDANFHGEAAVVAELGKAGV